MSEVESRAENTIHNRTEVCFSEVFRVSVWQIGDVQDAHAVVATEAKQIAVAGNDVIGIGGHGAFEDSIIPCTRAVP